MSIPDLAGLVFILAEVTFVIVSLLGTIVYPFAVVHDDDEVLRQPGVAAAWLFYGM